MRTRPGILLLAAMMLVSHAAPLFSEAGHDGGTPQLSLQAAEQLSQETLGSPVVFSIHGPGPAGGAFALKPEDLSGVKAWQIQIFDFYGSKVGYVQGQGRPASLEIPWSGFSADGKPLKDGSYTARLVWSDAEGFHKAPDTLVQLMAPPELKGLYAFDLRFIKTAKGLAIRIGGDLLFAAGRHEIQPQMLPALEKIAALIQERRRDKVLVRGFTDSVGALAANLVLSKRRAEAVYRFLVSRGVEGERLTCEGLGSQEPIDSNDTLAGRQRNRRVEVVLLEG